MAEQNNAGRVCDCEWREKIIAVLERMLELVESWISEEPDGESAAPGVGDVKQIMAIIKDMVAVMERLPVEVCGQSDSMANISDEELCNESERLVGIIRGGASAPG